MWQKIWQHGKQHVRFPPSELQKLIQTNQDPSHWKGGSEWPIEQGEVKCRKMSKFSYMREIKVQSDYGRVQYIMGTSHVSYVHLSQPGTGNHVFYFFIGFSFWSSFFGLKIIIPFLFRFSFFIFSTPVFHPFGIFIFLVSCYLGCSLSNIRSALPAEQATYSQNAFLQY